MNKKDKVLKCALQLFANQGFEKTSMANICEAANVSKGLVYHHFKSKNDILIAIFNDSSEQMKALNESFFSAPPRENLVLLIDSVFNYLKEEKLMFQLNLNITFQPSTRAILADQIKKRSEMLYNYVKRIFDEIATEQSEILSYMFLAEIDGIALDYLSVYENYPIDKLTNHLKNKYKNI